MSRPVQRIYRLQAGVDTTALLAALRRVVSRSPALRMRLVTTPAGLGQEFTDVIARIDAVRVEGRTPRLRAAYARHLLLEDARRPRDLTMQPPLMTRLIEVDGELYLGVCIDHLAADDLGFDAFERLLTEAYERVVADVAEPLSGDGYLRYIEKEHERRRAEAVNLAWWRDQLAGAPTVDDGTDDRSLSWVPGCSADWTLSGPALASLRRACRARRSPLSAAVLAAQLRGWRRRADNPDLVINLPVSNRVLPGEYAWVANMSMLLHVRLPPVGPDIELLDVRDRILEGMRRRHYDYGSLIDAVAADAASRGGRFNWLVGYSYIAEREASPVGGRLLAERLDGQGGETISVPGGSYSVSVRERPGELRVRAEWDSARWPLDQACASTEHLSDLAAVMPEVEIAT